MVGYIFGYIFPFVSLLLQTLGLLMVGYLSVYKSLVTYIWSPEGWLCLCVCKSFITDIWSPGGWLYLSVCKSLFADI